MLLKILIIFGTAFLLALITGLLLEAHNSIIGATHGKVLFWEPADMLVPALVLTVVLTLLFTFATPVGRVIIDAVGGGGNSGSGGSGATFVIFGGPMPIPIGGGLLCLIALLYLGGTSAMILLSLIGIIVAKVTDRKG